MEWWGSLMQVTGGVLQVAGVFTLAFGVTQTRKAFLPELDWWVARWWRAFTAKLSAAWAKLTRRKRAATVYLEGAGVAVGFGSTTVNVTKAYGPLPEDERARWGVIEDRLAELLAEMQVVQDQARDQGTELTKLSGHVDQEIEKVRAELGSQAEEHVRKLAASGLRTETWSVFLIGVGLALSTWGLILS